MLEHMAGRLGRCLLVCLLPAIAPAADYHVDSRNGDDAGDGLAPERAWKTLDRVNGASFRPGDRVLFRTGSVWPGP